MSRLFGPIRQMGYVVRDIESAMRHWIDVCGVGPFFYVDRLPLINFQYQGQSGDPHLSICLLYTSPSPRDATLSRMPSSA